MFDTHIVAIKPKFKEIANEEGMVLREYIPNEYRTMFTILLSRFLNLEDIIDYRNVHYAKKILIKNKSSLDQNLDFISRFRTTISLQQIIVDTMFDTLLSVYDPKHTMIDQIEIDNLNGMNKYIVVENDDILKINIISESTGIEGISLETPIKNILRMPYDSYSPLEKAMKIPIEISDKGITDEDVSV